MQQEQLRAQKSAMVEKETRREAILQHWQEDVGDEDEDNFEATLAKMKEEFAEERKKLRGELAKAQASDKEQASAKILLPWNKK